MEARTSDDLKQAFVLRDEHIRKLYKLLQDRFGPANIEAACADKIDRNFKTPAKLLKFENAKSREIETLTFSAFCQDKRAEIRFGRFLSSEIGWRISASDRVLTGFMRELGLLIESTRPWYSFIARSHSYTLDFLVFAFFGLSFTFAATYGLASLGALNETGSKDYMWPCAILGAICASIVTKYLNRIRVIVFPPAVFLVGHAIHRDRVLGKVRWIIVAIAIPLVATVFWRLSDLLTVIISP